MIPTTRRTTCKVKVIPESLQSEQFSSWEKVPSRFVGWQRNPEYQRTIFTIGGSNSGRKQAALMLISLAWTRMSWRSGGLKPVYLSLKRSEKSGIFVLG
jgi:hypothetical protein